MKFLIKYTDSDTEEPKQEIKEFFDTPGIVTRSDGSTYDIGPISARTWAEDWAYSAADKGSYEIKEIP